MNEQDEEPLADWLFFARKQRYRRRNTHRTLSNTTNTQESNK